MNTPAITQSKKTALYFTLFLIIAIGMTTPALAVDGYKNLKFGMTKKQVIDSGICTFGLIEKLGDGVICMNCADFVFGGESVKAGAFIVNDIFLRFAIMLPVDKFKSTTEALVNKYGAPSTMSSEAELKAVDSFPNREAFIGFDDDTVGLKLMSNEIGSQSIILIYTSPKYERHLQKSQQQSVKDDI